MFSPLSILMRNREKICRTPAQRTTATQKKRKDLCNTASSSASYSRTAGIRTLEVLHLASLDTGGCPLPKNSASAASTGLVVKASFWAGEEGNSRFVAKPDKWFLGDFSC